MVKRACPFSDDMNPQLKLHVSEKEVAQGVMSDQHMKNIYAKTRGLLFLGAKKAPSAPVASAVNSKLLMPESKISGDASSTHPCGIASLKQMLLTCEGLLSTPKDVNQNNQLKIKVPCSKCADMNFSETYQCFFCDTTLCPKCIQACNKCHENFCAACSFNMYDGSDGFICRNCC